MKFTNLLLLIVGAFSCLLCSCEKGETNAGDSAFRIVFSDGNTIGEHDISFYDSSTYTLFLKKNMTFKSPNLKEGFNTFKVIVNNDSIYGGIIFPCIFSSFPPSEYIIGDCFMYAPNIIEIRSYTETHHLRNDSRIIEALKSKGLLRNGISCTINNIQVTSFDNYSAVTSTITIKNNDNINYYIPDPAKMGNLDFNYYTGGFTFINSSTNKSSFLRWSVQSPDWSWVSMDDLSLLKAGEQVVYTFTSNDYYKIEKGTYQVRFRFSGLKNNVSSFKLNQNQGRIWIGEALTTTENFTVN